MNIQSNTSSHFLYLLTLAFVAFLSMPLSYADDDKRNYMGMGHGHMGYGNMGNGHMGQGHMGYGHMGSHQMGMMGMGYGFMNNLDLSKEQRTTMRNIHKEMRTQQFALQDKISELSDELQLLYKEDKPNVKKVSSVYKKIFDIKRQQIELGITTKNKSYDVLNKEQKDKLKELQSSASNYRFHQGMHGQGMSHMMD